LTAVLLDTNAFAMALTDDPRLPQAARARLGRAARVAVSVITFYEIGQKVRLGKWPGMAPHVAGLEHRARDDGYDLLPLTAAAALEAAIMDWAHRDPFDRMIATVARHETLPLVSSDTAFDALAIERIWE
jgi:PIN domain nuclease of toxin-antitoxin system